MHHDEEDFSELQAQLSALPRDIAPARDLRADIWRQIDDAQVIPLEPRRPVRWATRVRLATAAVLLVVASSALTFALMKNREQPLLTYAPDGRILVSDDAGRLERAYSDELRDLQAVLRKSRGTLAPETVRILEDNLAIIDNAIREAKGALAADPNSEMLIDLLRSAYERKLELLRQAAKSSAT